MDKEPQATLHSSKEADTDSKKRTPSINSTTRNPVELPSSEEESMAEIDDDYDGESCFSVDDLNRTPKKRLDQMNDAVQRICAGGESHMPTIIQQLPIDVLTAPISHDLLLKGSPELQTNSISRGTDFAKVASVETDHVHLPRQLPTFPDPKSCMWTSSHAANCPSEDRSCSLVNVLLRPPGREASQNHSLIRLSLWSVIDGHGGGCVATYASEVLLPHIAASVSRALKCTIIDRGVCTVNGELRDANALDLDGLIHTSDKSRANPHSVHYRAPYESQEATEGEDGANPRFLSEDDTVVHESRAQSSNGLPVDQCAPSVDPETAISPPLLPQSNTTTSYSVSSAKTSIKTGPAGPAGTHSASEVNNVMIALTESFLAVDEGWINSIDPVATHQTSCHSNGRWNAGACALVAFTVQRLDWMETSVEDRKTTVAGRDLVGRDTSHNEDAARRRMLDDRARGKSASSVSSISSESSILTDYPNAESAIESEITETEDDGDDASCVRESNRKLRSRKVAPTSTPPFQQCLINTPGGCHCHSYRAHEAMLYTAHVGDCRAVLLGSSPPRTIKVRPASGGPSLDHPDTTDDESSYHSSDETECLSSSDHDAESSDEEGPSIQAPPYMSFVRRAACRQRAKRREMGSHAPFFALPPLRRDAISSEEESEAEIEPSPSAKLYPSRVVRTGSDSEDDNASNETLLSETHEMSPPLHLAPYTRPIDLTTDHSAYNPVEVALVRRRCNNAPRAISSGIGGGIKRVAGSLAVTRALGDAYLKTPSLSFDPYRRNCPYITARPETSCRLLSREGDTVLILASDGVWERCKGEDILRWIRNYSAERIADAERKNSRRRGTDPDRVSQDSVTNERSGTESVHDENESDATLGHKRELQASPLPIHMAKKQKKRKVIPLPVRDSPRSSGLASVSTVADVIVRRVLNKVRKARNMTSLQALMTLPKGRARRSKHDDITASVVALSAFVSPPSTTPQKG